MTPDTAYHPVRSSEPSASSTEIEESLIGEKSDWHPPRALTRRGRAWALLRSNWWIVDTSLILIILVLVAESRWHGWQKQRYEFAGDVTGFAPRFSQQITKFGRDLSFVPENTSEFWSDAVQEKWLSIVPKGLGYVHVEHPAEYDNLPTPIHDYTNMTVLTTSMPHQLHCLYNILAVYSAITSENPRELPTAMTFHLQHCFEYLRLSIMCCGDVALEGAETTFPEGFMGSDGWDALHVCKDYGQIYEYLDQNRANDRLWI
ncbi:uncharacterized protein BDZ99DRAFT_425255 [Mytilinidion resinicola]|uniref:Uncharacterized protein n=1 Tax=Mytilinidion resinicola TaxID=574789 RepID=A0A6A6YA59_9PEZI|nr:uncharacterized protein BDZ99DRAFT_425255 [Mytilinidion resinicola]KAF2805005.1 hypothetical protein BDZ99DRAFT_425255 [Mytilinidion resinicola]